MTDAAGLMAVDIGNSSTKLGWYPLPLAVSPTASSLAGQLPQPTRVFGYPTDDAPSADLAAQLPTGPLQWRVASVHRAGTERLRQWVADQRPSDTFTALSHRDLPIEVRVEAPEKVGLDRLAAAVAANALREHGRPAIVVDAGSAVTVDLVAADGRFEGGAILAGFRLSAQALFGGTDALPLTSLEPTEPPLAVGKHTHAAIRSGLFWGLVGSVKELVARIAEGLDTEPHVFITGGDLVRLADFVDPRAKFIPNLVLAGIALSSGSGAGAKEFESGGGA